jgi:hypothetical protein
MNTSIHYQDGTPADQPIDLDTKNCRAVATTGKDASSLTGRNRRSVHVNSSYSSRQTDLPGQEGQEGEEEGRRKKKKKEKRERGWRSIQQPTMTKRCDTA